MRRLRALLASAILVLPGCGKLPTGEEPPPLNLPPAAPLGTAQPVTPAPPPNPDASPSPGAPSPTPSPTATPAPSPGAACRLPPMPECAGPEGPPGVYGCCRDEGVQVFADQVEQAIVQLQRERPDLFSGTRVLNEDAYVQGVARLLEQRGLCSRQGAPSDEIAVKNSQGFSEQYDILLSSGHIRNGGYTVTCRPARF